MAGTALPLMFASVLQAQGAVPVTSPPVAEAAAVASPSQSEAKTTTTEASKSWDATLKTAAGGEVGGNERSSTYKSRWFVRAGGLGALYNSHAVFSSEGVVIPGANAKALDGPTVSFDLGYDVTDKLALMLMGGVPPRLAVVGQGTVGPFGTLGAVRYGPVILTAIYRFPEWRGLRPYAGGGGVHAFILRNFAGAVSPLTVNDSWGYAVQAGLEYRLNHKWSVYVDYKRVWLSVKAKGLLEGIPVRGLVTLNPDVISAGFKFHFG